MSAWLGFAPKENARQPLAAAPDGLLGRSEAEPSAELQRTCALRLGVRRSEGGDQTERTVFACVDVSRRGYGRARAVQVQIRMIEEVEHLYAEFEFALAVYAEALK